MARSHAGTRRIAIIVTAPAILIAGCNGRRIDPEPSVATASRLGNDLSLAASVEQSYVLGPDPIAVSYAVRNRGAPRHVRSHPIWFDFVVLSPSGRRLRPLPGEDDFEPPLNALGAEVLLATDSVLRGTVNLRCIRLAAAEYPHEAYGKKCIFGYELPKSGEYRVVVRYRPQAFGAPAIESDTIRLRYRRE